MGAPAPSGAEARVRAWVSGRVQGVAYRAYAREEGRRLRLSGWVRNLADGRVELVAEGPRDRLEELVAWCRTGPPFAKVDAVDCVWEEPRGERGRFDVIH